jgi:hypothetical protein
MMKLGPQILKILNKKYEPDSQIQTTFNRYDLAFKTDEEGNPVLLFLGKLNEKGLIKGFRYARTLIRNKTGEIIKDHWELKGKAS